jgi:ribonuclease III
MSGQPQDSLRDLLCDQNPDVDRIITTFVSRFNALYGNPAADRWDIQKEKWQRYEFLGDRVLGLIVAQSLFTFREGGLTEGDMTRILNSVVSNRALDALSRRFDNAVFSRLIPATIGKQNTYGERITGGAFEAFIGALYCEFGLSHVAFFVIALLGDTISESCMHENAIGILQEYFQKRGENLPVYQETSRTGPDHRPQFSIRVRIADDRTFEGSGPSLPYARKDAAQKALDGIGWKP